MQQTQGKFRTSFCTLATSIDALPVPKSRPARFPRGRFGSAFACFAATFAGGGGGGITLGACFFTTGGGGGFIPSRDLRTSGAGGGAFGCEGSAPSTALLGSSVGEALSAALLVGSSFGGARSTALLTALLLGSSCGGASPTGLTAGSFGGVPCCLLACSHVPSNRLGHSIISHSSIGSERCSSRSLARYS